MASTKRPSIWEKEDEWELINDDGFVYKRKKRPCLDSTAPTSTTQPDPAWERKRKTLVKLKQRYQKEINWWELLSNTLKDLNISKSHRQRDIDRIEINQPPVDSPLKSTGFSICLVLDDLLAQVEAQESMITNVSYLCDAAEVLCNAQEQVSKNSFFNLPIWALSPDELIDSLCQE